MLSLSLDRGPEPFSPLANGPVVKINIYVYSFFMFLLVRIILGRLLPAFKLRQTSVS